MRIGYELQRKLKAYLKGGILYQGPFKDVPGDTILAALWQNRFCAEQDIDTAQIKHAHFFAS